MDHRDVAIIKILEKTESFSFLNFFSGSPCAHRNRRSIPILILLLMVPVIKRVNYFKSENRKFLLSQSEQKESVTLSISDRSFRIMLMPIVL